MPRLELSRQTGRAHGAIAFAEQELGRCPAVEARQVDANEIAESLKVAAHAMKRLGIFCGAAETGRDGVDIHKICYVEQRELVFDKLKRSRGLESILCHLDPARAERTHVQPNTCRPGSAVVTERDGPGARVLALTDVGDEEHARVRLGL